MTSSTPTKRPARAACRAVRKRFLPLSRYLKGLGNGGAESVRLNFDGKEIDFSVERFTLNGGWTFDMIEQAIMGNADGVGYDITPGVKSDIGRSLFYMPEGNAPTLDGTMVPYWCIKYMQPGIGMAAVEGMEAIFHRIETGGLAKVPTSREMVQNVDIWCHTGLEATLPEHFGAWKTI